MKKAVFLPVRSNLYFTNDRQFCITLKQDNAKKQAAQHKKAQRNNRRDY